MLKSVICQKIIFFVVKIIFYGLGKYQRVAGNRGDNVQLI